MLTFTHFFVRQSCKTRTEFSAACEVRRLLRDTAERWYEHALYFAIRKPNAVQRHDTYITLFCSVLPAPVLTSRMCRQHRCFTHSSFPCRLIFPHNPNVPCRGEVLGRAEKFGGRGEAMDAAGSEPRPANLPPWCEMTQERRLCRSSKPPSN